MKIDGNLPNLDAQAAARLDALRVEDTKKKDAPARAGGADQVSVSSDVQLATSAIDAAQQATDVRPEAVERAKALLAAGQVGADPQALADKLIDRALEP
jgi:flagellar biosynthesis anti-sigma factor FlgM